MTLFQPSRSFRKALRRYWRDVLLAPLALAIALAATIYLLLVLPVTLWLWPEEPKA